MRNYIIEYYKARNGYRWRLKGGNGQVVADSGEAYSTKANAARAWHHILAKLMDGRLTVRDLTTQRG